MSHYYSYTVITVSSMSNNLELVLTDLSIDK
ncbi:Fe3+-citrate ABC transporter substrate-binding protein, partial [Vibrio sp. V22_P2S10T140]|nr:Fe3+-citrate ABC transporter substrate-binding protein [Vibrio sp. V22_P2S10T140]